MIRLSAYGINIILETDNPNVKYMLESVVEEKKYNGWQKRWEVKKVKRKIYNRYKTDPSTGHVFFEIGVGFSAYLLKIFGGEISRDDYNDVLGALCQPTYRTQAFPELRDYQNEDILHVLKYKFGIMSVYTGYGKTSVIACLSKYYYQDLGKKVLIVTPNTKPRDEVVKRIKNNYGIDVSTKLGQGGIQAIITQGFTNKKDFKDPEKRKLIDAELETFDILLVDELEYCNNDAGEYIFGAAKNVEARYGYSGTADKSSANVIGFTNGLNDPIIANNIGIIKYFGTSLVYKKPLDRVVNMISVLSESLNPGKLKLWELVGDDTGNLYHEVLSKIFSDKDVSELLMKVCKKFPLTFIPVNNLQAIIYNWIDNYFLGNFNILLICAEGYLYYNLQGEKSNLSLQETSDLIGNGGVDVIFSTSSGWRALDLPGLKNIIILQGQIAGSVIQQCGRVSRSTEFNVICLEPKDGKTLPVYTKTQKNQKELIRNYYQYCKINNITLMEEDL